MYEIFANITSRMPLSDQDQLQTLLDQVGYIDFQYQKSKQNDRFNIFNVLSHKFDEVNLHSRFLHHILDPNGHHNCGTDFLKHLLDVFAIKDFSFEKIKVRKEYRKIDLLITNQKQAIVIENKIWAIDQPTQLQRYYELLLSEGYRDIRIFYLSIDGKEPAEYSIGTLRHHANFDSLVTCISYKTDIEQWLERCIKDVYAKPTLRETLIQYRSLIWEISGKTMYKDEMEEIVEFLSIGENMLRAKKIAENWNHARWYTEWYFWQDLEKLISQHYEISSLQKYSSDSLNSVIHHRRNQNPWYGIMFKIGMHLDAEACIFIERGGGSDSVYYGLTMVIGSTKEHSGDLKFKPLADSVAEFSEWHQETHWIGGNYCEPEINFNEFSNPETLKLLNSDYRSKYVNGLWKQIEAYTKQVLPLLEK